jgi:SAM-dependent methyltransferase
MPTTFYSAEEFRAEQSSADFVCSLSRRFEETLSYFLRDDDCLKSGCYRHIPLENSSFKEMLIPAIKHFGTTHSIRFLDVGCGIGTKLLLAGQIAREQNSYLYTSGVEINAKYAEFARAFTKSKITNCDARQFSDYAQFDIVYFYCPFADEKKQRELERIIFNKTKKDVVLIQALKQGKVDPKKLKLIYGSNDYGVFTKI